jgi:hypothetical protein
VNKIYKEIFNSWSTEVYSVERFEDRPEGGVSDLTGYRRPLLRFELKKIEDAHRIVVGEARSVLNQITVRPPVPAAALPPQPVLAPGPVLVPGPVAVPAPIVPPVAPRPVRRPPPIPKRVV